jgi:SPP1 gp7 family putative phage head morphogenesis protein
LIRHKIFVERYAGGVANRLQTIINKARDIAIARVINEGLTNIDTLQLELELQNELEQVTRTITEEINNYTEVEANFLVNTLRKGLKEEISLPDLDKVNDRVFSKTMQVGLAEKINNRSLAAALTLFSRRKAKELVQPIKDSQVSGENEIETGLKIGALAVGLMSAQTKSLSRTAITHTQLVTSDEVFKENKEIIKEVEWVSVLDSRTTDYCQEQNGKRYKVGQGPRPPAHFNCRSIVQPVVPGIDS